MVIMAMVVTRSARAARFATATAARRTVSYILGIETSCDDTAAAVLDSNGNVLSNIVSSQWELNAKWKGADRVCVCVHTSAYNRLMHRCCCHTTGIVPALAARAHEENLPHVIRAAIEQRCDCETLQRLLHTGTLY